MKPHAQIFTLAACTLGLTVAAVTSRADVFNWNSITYAPTSAQATAAGGISLGNSSNGTNSARIQFTLNNGATFIPAGNSTDGTAYRFPISASYSQNNTAYASGGGADAQKSLQIGANFSGNTTANQQSFTVTITFAQPVVSVNFSFFDVDTNTSTATTFYTDRVSAIQGNLNGGTAVIPTVTNTGSTTNTVSGNVITATANNPANSAGGNATVTFSSTSAINQLSFVYGDNYTSSNHSITQAIALSNITFTNQVPEPGTLAMLSLGVFGAAGVVLRRRC